ncbi:two-component system phosphate regulon sensor histidine kinase PhoR [Melghiribacillus thermohalophilus]|uniref:histidine kinase n=1 Tax=Melghiribacillus thermohalophilus TaxID=1324956 RepID=A0A4R3NCS5_9BACI|nr:ATP-binding protein [Melghiribacillus thermohalophilus]TCT24993.1 two-component system phosphate regulon sensor histidine kinase PhoR [Melghiribacillus thermohalophilus]
MNKSTIRPILIFSSVIVLIMTIIGLILGQLIEQFMTETIKARMDREGSYVVSTIESMNPDAPGFKHTIVQISKALEIGIILHENDDGKILDTTDQLFYLPEQVDRSIKELMDLEIGRETVFLDDFYLSAQSFETSQWSGTVILILSSAQLTQVIHTVWIIFAAFIAALSLFILIFGYNMYEKYVKPVKAATDTALQLANGNYNARIYEGHFGDAGQLSHAINLLARNLQEMTLHSKIQSNRLQAVVDSMGSALMLIDEKGYINLVNKAFLESFSGKYSDYIGYLYYDAFPREEIHNLVRDVFMTEDHVQQTIVVSSGIERRFFAVFGAPIFNERKDWKGTVLVFHDITEIKRLEEIRKDFVANVSHELKTPITSIKGFSETLLEGAKDDPELLDEFLTIIYKESRRMQLLIKDLLELSKLEREDVELHIETVSLKEMVSDVLTLVDYHAADKNITITSDIYEDIRFECDASRIKQVLLNLVTNAISYTPGGGKVIIGTKDEIDEFTLIIKDTGIGIPEEDLPRIFERFYRVDKARSRNSGGTGLGLAIVKHIVEAHHGKIDVRSEINKGTTFYITLKKKFTKY